MRIDVETGKQSSHTTKTIQPSVAEVVARVSSGTEQLHVTSISKLYTNGSKGCGTIISTFDYIELFSDIGVNCRSLNGAMFIDTSTTPLSTHWKISGGLDIRWIEALGNYSLTFTDRFGLHKSVDCFDEKKLITFPEALANPNQPDFKEDAKTNENIGVVKSDKKITTAKFVGTADRKYNITIKDKHICLSSVTPFTCNIVDDILLVTSHMADKYHITKKEWFIDIKPVDKIEVIGCQVSSLCNLLYGNSLSVSVTSGDFTLRSSLGSKIYTYLSVSVFVDGEISIEDKTISARKFYGSIKGDGLISTPFILDESTLSVYGEGTILAISDKNCLHNTDIAFSEEGTIKCYDINNQLMWEKY